MSSKGNITREGTFVVSGNSGHCEPHPESAESSASCHLNVSSELSPFHTLVRPATPTVMSPFFSSSPSAASRSGTTSSGAALPLLRARTILPGIRVCMEEAAVGVVQSTARSSPPGYQMQNGFGKLGVQQLHLCRLPVINMSIQSSRTLRNRKKIDITARLMQYKNCLRAYSMADIEKSCTVPFHYRRLADQRHSNAVPRMLSVFQILHHSMEQI